MYKIITTPNEKMFGLKKLYGLGYGLPVIACLIGFTCFWFLENKFLDILFDEKNNY